MLEGKIQAKLIKSLEKDGYYVIKLGVTNKPGIPDLIAIPKNADVLFVEVKQQGKKPRALQNYRAKEIKEHGLKVKLYDGEWKEMGSM